MGPNKCLNNETYQSHLVSLQTAIKIYALKVCLTETLMVKLLHMQKQTETLWRIYRICMSNSQYVNSNS